MNRIKTALTSALALLLLLTACTSPENPVPPSLPDETPSQTELVESDDNFSEPGIPETPADSFASVSFGGDILVHSSLYGTAKTGDDTYEFTQFLENGMEGFFDSDWNVVNMENPVDVNGDNSGISNYPSFNAPREIVDLAVSLGVDTAIYCNNHIYDKKYAGFRATVEHISEKLEVTGAYLSEEEYRTPYIRDVNGIKIGLLCYTDHVNGYSDSRLEPYSVRTFALSTDSAPAMIEDIRWLKDAGAEAVIVYMHWGAEYKDAPNTTQKELARALCEGGADVIVGGHSHCVQPIENYTFTDENGEEKTSVIFYSLGNFFVDQTGLQTSENYGPAYVKTQHGVKATLYLKKEGATGKVTVTGGEYVPTVLLRRKSGGKYIYLFLESGAYAAGETRPAVFSSDSDWRKCIEAYERVCEIMGDALPAKTYS